MFLMAHGEASGSLVAAQRIPAESFPIAFSIGSADHMMVAGSFAGALRISARIDTDGNAATRDVGDLLGSAVQSHQPGDRGVVVRISEVQTGESSAAASRAAATGAASAAIETERAAAALPATASGTTSAAIEGTIELAPDLAGRVPPGAVLYLIAKTAQGGPPLAVVRIANPSFPMQFSIGPDNRMNQSMPFAGELLITTRVDGDGNAMTRNPGDLQGASGSTHAPGDRGVTLLIDEVL
jgi:cytochrome c-type biogenesis protein CcmH